MSEQEKTKTNLTVKSKTPCLLERSVSIRPATTTDGFTVFANKHYTAYIEHGTLQNAIGNGYVDAHDALIARTMNAQRIAREIMESKRRKLGVPDETEAPETSSQAKSADAADAADAASAADAVSAAEKQ